MQICAERPADSANICHVLTDAFGQSDEACLVEQLRLDGDLVYSLVAKDINNGHSLIGHIALSRLVLPQKALALAPVGVIHSCQNRGIGAALINSALARATDDGFDVVFVLGNPDYYSKFGFSLEMAEPFESDYSGPHFMALWLGAARQPPGKVIYPKAFDDLE